MIARALTEADLPRVQALSAFGPPGDADPTPWLPCASDEDPPSALVVAAGDLVLGAARATLGRRALSLDELRLNERAAEGVVEALAGWAEDELPGLALEIRVAALPEDGPLARALRRSGLRLLRDLHAFHRDLGDGGPGAPDPFDWTALVGAARRGALGSIWDILQEDPYFRRRGLDPAEALDELLEEVSDATGAQASWHLARLEGRIVGLALGAVDPASSLGWLQYIGLAPAARGRGLGRALHAGALRRLAAAGARTYEDAVDLDRAAMRRVMLANGCTMGARAQVWRLHRPPPPERIDGVEALRRWLSAEGHRPEASDDGRWLRVRWRCGRTSAPLELGWDADSGLVQLLCVLPGTVPSPIPAALYRELGVLNSTLHLPGFFADETRGVLGLRLPLPLEGGREIATRQLRRAADLVVRQVDTHRPTLLAAMERERGWSAFVRMIPADSHG